MTFDLLGLHPHILKALTKVGYETPTEIQAKAIPKILQGFDVRASAATGTGKTGAFLLPLLHLLTQKGARQGKGPRILVLVPTRELAMQIAQEAQRYSQYMHRIRTVSIFGGVPYGKQYRDLAEPYDLLIATPGRLIDMMEQSRVHFSRLEMFVLDEADRMLDMGFSEPLEEIIAHMPHERQTLLFSATFDEKVRALSEKLLSKPMDIVVKKEIDHKVLIEEGIYYVDGIDHKQKLLDHLLKSIQGPTIIFTATKRHADLLADQLLEQGLEADALHGDMSQRERTRTITRLKSGRTQILVATDVASRGIDVPGIGHVINFDLPNSPEDYVHRIGRTGRAGATGVSSSFVSSKDAHLVRGIEGYTGKKATILEIEGLEPLKKVGKGTFRKKKKPFGFKKKRFRPPLHQKKEKGYHQRNR